MADIKRAREFAGKGAAIQAAAFGAGVLASVIATPLVGAFVGGALFAIGSEKSKVSRCSECDTKLKSAAVSACPNCGAHFTRPKEALDDASRTD